MRGKRTDTHGFGAGMKCSVFGDWGRRSTEEFVNVEPSFRRTYTSIKGPNERNIRARPPRAGIELPSLDEKARIWPTTWHGCRRSVQPSDLAETNHSTEAPSPFPTGPGIAGLTRVFQQLDTDHHLAQAPVLVRYAINDSNDRGPRARCRGDQGTSEGPCKTLGTYRSSTSPQFGLPKTVQPADPNVFLFHNHNPPCCYEL